MDRTQADRGDGVKFLCFVQFATLMLTIVLVGRVG
jgi:hypothetical protein